MNTRCSTEAAEKEESGAAFSARAHRHVPGPLPVRFTAGRRTSGKRMAQNAQDATAHRHPHNHQVAGLLSLPPQEASMVTFEEKPTLRLNFWDPISFEHEESSPQCRLRTKRDIMDLHTEPPFGVYIAPEEDNITKIHALLLGPEGTPYEGGFFHFLLQCPPDYPIQPPRVRLMTTDSGRVRFNPNLYENGKVCLSILGTWEGPAWSPAQCIGSVLISIQSLMTENPYYNEPGFESERRPGDAQRYNTIIQHETIRVAVCDMVESCLTDYSLCPQSLKEVVLNKFPDNYKKYEEVVKSHLDMSGSRMSDPFGTRRGLYQYDTLLQRLQKLKEEVKKWKENPKEKKKRE